MPETGRMLGLDVGDVRIGVAVSDLLGMIAHAREVIKCDSPDRDVEAIRSIAEETEAIRVVVGVPLDQRGEPGPQARKVLAFIQRLRAVLPIEVVTQDERFSTAAAERMLIESRVRRKGRRKVVDKVAAQYILQTYLDRLAHQNPR